MKINSKIKKITALMLVIALGISTFVISSVYAADAVDTNRTCTIRFAVPIEKLNSVDSFSAKLYKVAEIDSSAKYKLTENFASISEIESVDENTTVEQWQEYANKAFARISQNTKADYSLDFVKGKARVQTSVGLYLVVIDEIKTPTDIFRFTPYLISVPGNNYKENGDDTWLYEVDSLIKAEQETRYGKLVIEKKIDTFNLSMKDATCVFKVEAVKDGELVYSDVVAIDFKEYGTNSVTIEHIPAGAEVTVTEVYSSGSYKNTSGVTQTTTIVADDEDGNSVKVSFENTYNNRLITGGTAVVNRFSKNQDGSWSWEKKSE